MLKSFWLVDGEWCVVLVLINGLKKILVFKLNQQYMIGLTQEPFDTNDDGRTEGQSEIWRCYRI